MTIKVHNVKSNVWHRQIRALSFPKYTSSPVGRVPCVGTYVVYARVP